MDFPYWLGSTIVGSFYVAFLANALVKSIKSEDKSIFVPVLVGNVAFCVVTGIIGLITRLEWVKSFPVVLYLLAILAGGLFEPLAALSEEVGANWRGWKNVNWLNILKAFVGFVILGGALCILVWAIISGIDK